MIFHSLKLAYFRSFKEPQVLRFSDHPVGFFMLYGEHGSGKSSTLDGLCWTLYGKTTRNLSSTDIANWSNTSATLGEVYFEIKGRYYTLTRTHQPNALKLKAKGSRAESVKQEDIDRLLGLDHSGFLAVVLMGQFNRFFFDLTPGEKLEVFSDTLRLSFWTERAESAGRMVKRLEQRIIDLEKEEVRLVTSFSSVSENLEELHQTDNNSKLILLEVKRLDSQLLKEAKRIKVIRGKLDTLGDEYRSASKVLQSSDLDFRKAEKQQYQIQSQIEQTQQRIREVGLQLDRLTKAKSQCPTCGQAITPEHLQSERGQIKTALEVLKIKSLELEDQKVKIEGSLKTLNQSIQDQTQRVKEIQVEEESLKLQLQQLQKSHSLTQAKSSTLKGQLDASRKVDQRIEELQGKKAQLESSLTLFRNDLLELRRQVQGFTYWSKEFRHVRLWLIEESLKQLEVEVTNCLTELGLAGWRVKFDVERTTKAGKLSRGFNVLIESPLSERPIRWECWCGAETQRLRIAGAIGLANLIRSRTGIDPNLEIWDEPTAHLNERSVSELLTFFEGRSRMERRQIWMVDHRSLHAGNFDRKVSVTFNPDLGSRIEGSYIHNGVVQGGGKDCRTNQTINRSKREKRIRGGV